MIPQRVRFLSDEGDATSIDLEILTQERQRILRVLSNRGDSQSMTVGRANMDMIELPNGDYIFVGWFAPNDEEAVVYSLAAGAIEAPPGD